MRNFLISIGAALGALVLAEPAHAHLLACDKTVNGTTYVEISDYPATLDYEFKLINAHPDLASYAESAGDPYLASIGFSFEPAPPYWLDLGEVVTDTFQVNLASHEECLDLAALDGVADNRFDNMFEVTWHDGAAYCWATVVCIPPPEGEATRTPGFFKTHEEALTACLAEGSIDLGILTVSSLEAALGLLWGSPAVYDNGDSRSAIDQARFLLARHTMVGICNERLFDNSTDPADLLEDAVAAIVGTDCALMHELQGMIDDFNNSGDDVAFPEGFEPGPATPQHASSIADDPTSPSGDVCQ